MPAISRPVRVLTSVLAVSATVWLGAPPGAAAAAAPAPTPAKASSSPSPQKTPAPTTSPAQSAASPTPPAPPAPDTPFPLPPAQPPAPAASPAAPASPAKPISVAPPTGKADDGAYVASETWLDPRMADLKIGSLSVGAMVPVRIIVPASWSADSGGVTWPVLFLLHGAHDDYTAWTRETDVESFVANKNVIVVMPEDGPTGIPTRWWNGGKQKPDYETFDAVELMQLLERDYNAGSTRAVAGVSTGGYGAIMMAAHYPQTFAAAASYSGVLNTTYPGMPAVMRAIVARESIQPDALWGDPLHNIQLWNEDNPYAQATNLRWTSLFLSCGDGQGPVRDLALGQTLEHAIQPQNIAFANRLSVLGIPLQADFYTGGVHNWVSWKTAFTTSWPMLAASLGLPN